MYSIKKTKGFSLIEVLAAFVISSVGLLGLATTQILSVKNINNTQFRTLATMYAYDMVERMRSNRVALEAGAYDDINGDESAVSCTVCTAQQIAQQDAYEWNIAIRQNSSTGGLPEGLGTVTRNGNVFNVVVSWKEQVKDSVGTTIAVQSFTLNVRL